MSDAVPEADMEERIRQRGALMAAATQLRRGGASVACAACIAQSSVQPFLTLIMNAAAV